jgi:8-amino-7-oxononanoate synthase
MNILRDHARHLEALSAKARHRSLIPRAGIDFASNDYLALAASETLRDAARVAAAARQRSRA